MCVTIRSILQRNHPQTVRQVFYRLVSQGAIAKTEAEYKGTVIKQLTKMRLAGDLPFGYIADNTRWVRKPTTYDSKEDALFRTAQTYRRNILNDQNCYIEIWLEKDALAGVLYQETKTYDIPLFVNRGYASLTYLYDATKYLEREGKTTYIYYFGDHDPSGLDIARNTLARIRQFALDCDIHFRRVAVTEEQILEQPA